MHEMSEITLTVLRAILDHGPISRPHLQMMLPDKPVDSAIVTLQTKRLVASERGSRIAMYEATPKGRRLHAQPDGSGVVGGPRMPHSGGYTGPATTVTRPGAMDAFEKPSRRGEEFVPHATPISLASHVQGTKFP